MLLGLACATGCGDRLDPFPPGLAPLEENEAPWPSGDAEAPYPEALATTSFAMGREDWGHARGYLHVAPERLWDIWQDPLVVADRRNTTEQTITVGDDPDYELSYVTRYLVQNLVDVRWTEQSRGGHLIDDPRAFIVRYQKTEGSAFLSLIEGSFIVRPAAEGISEIEMIHHQDVVGSDRSNIERVHRDQFESLRAVSVGEPLPVW